ncbi:RNA polymerase sigma factor [Leucobacter viscericola]|uniref:RNA polymerase sigma factor n=1 Tax=Leucobacter viscericola TaxID=2714935 RepID=A0A6G7XIF1_9MICO|nr:RNA polymerase sigma factor [Leucobacter viscericola]QIK64394.1 RNA polymerase sigma factor [Leucobacter viscericola]
MNEKTTVRKLSVEEEQQVLLRAREGDRAALGELYLLHHPYVLAHARRFLHDPGSSEDLVQDAFVATCEAIRRGKGPKFSFGHYWMTAIRSIALQKNTKSAREVLSGGIEDYVTDLAEDLPVEDTGAVDAFLTLPERRRKAIWLRAVQGVSVKEAATAMDLSPAAFSVLYYRAKEEMRLSFLLTVDVAKLPEACRPFFAMLPALVRNSLRGAKAKRLQDHLSICDSCREQEQSMLAVASRFVAVLPLLAVIPSAPDPAAAAAQTTAGAKSATAWPLRAKLLAGVAGSAVAVTAVVVAISLSGSGGSGTAAQSSGGEAETLVAQVVGSEGACAVHFVPGSQASSRFIASNETGGSCTIGIRFDGETVRHPLEVQKYEIIMAPRTGIYSFSVEAPEQTVARDFEVQAGEETK